MVLHVIKIEEADGRLNLQVHDVTCHDIKSALLYKKKHSNVVELAISFFHKPWYSKSFSFCVDLAENKDI